MGDPERATDASSFSNALPPGVRFYPSDQQLVCHYLTAKNSGAAAAAANNGSHWGIDVIKEIDLYNLEPFKSPEPACFRFGSGGSRRHWYYFVDRILKDRERRRTAGGYWKKKGRVRDVVSAGAGTVVVGTRQSFVFYLKDSPRHAVKTDWVMYEYALVDHPQTGSFVLCRVFLKPQMRNSLSEHILSSCGDGSIATVRHVGVQCDEKNSCDNDNKVSNVLTKGGDELDGNIKYKPISQQDMNPTASVDEDFIELDDLLCPLPGIE